MVHVPKKSFTIQFFEPAEWTFCISIRLLLGLARHDGGVGTLHVLSNIFAQELITGWHSLWYVHRRSVVRLLYTPMLFIMKPTIISSDTPAAQATPSLPFLIPYIRGSEQALGFFFLFRSTCLPLFTACCFQGDLFLQNFGRYIKRCGAVQKSEVGLIKNIYAFALDSSNHRSTLYLIHKNATSCLAIHPRGHDTTWPSIVFVLDVAQYRRRESKRGHTNRGRYLAIGAYIAFKPH
jgi:hypothetical protein